MSESGDVIAGIYIDGVQKEPRRKDKKNWIVMSGKGKDEKHQVREIRRVHGAETRDMIQDKVLSREYIHILMAKRNSLVLRITYSVGIAFDCTQGTASREMHGPTRPHSGS